MSATPSEDPSSSLLSKLYASVTGTAASAPLSPGLTELTGAANTGMAGTAKPSATMLSDSRVAGCASFLGASLSARRVRRAAARCEPLISVFSRRRGGGRGILGVADCAVVVDVFHFHAYRGAVVDVRGFQLPGLPGLRRDHGRRELRDMRAAHDLALDEGDVVARCVVRAEAPFARCPRWSSGDRKP